MGEYYGFKEITFDDKELAEVISPGALNKYECLRNEYLVARDSLGEIAKIMKCNGESFVKVPYKVIDSRFLDKVKPRNPGQQMAIDLLYDTGTTVKVITGKFGTGKDFLMCSAAIDLIEHNKFEKIVYVRNNIEVKNSKPIGHLPGSYNEKLLPFAMPLADHLGGTEGLNMMINKGQVEVVHLGFIRGRDIKNSIIITKM